MVLNGSHMGLTNFFISCVTVISVQKKRVVWLPLSWGLLGCLCSEDTRPIAGTAQLHNHGSGSWGSCWVGGVGQGNAISLKRICVRSESRNCRQGKTRRSADVGKYKILKENQGIRRWHNCNCRNCPFCCWLLPAWLTKMLPVSYKKWWPSSGLITGKKSWWLAVKSSRTLYMFDPKVWRKENGSISKSENTQKRWGRRRWI